MIQVLAAICVLQALALGCTLWVMKRVIDSGREDRKELTEQILALTNIPAYQATKTGHANGKVTFLDDEAMANLERTDDEA